MKYTSNNNLIKWTTGAIDCYNRGCVCNGCPTYQIIGKQCQMKKAVIGLVAKFGKPEKRKK